MPPSRKPIHVDEDDGDNVLEARGAVPEYPDASKEHHLSSISIMYNRIDFHVLGKIVYDFRADNTENPDGPLLLEKITLIPLVNPQTQAEHSAIEVYFHGKWQSVCAPLKKHDIICLANASVENANDPEYHEFQLAFYDQVTNPSPSKQHRSSRSQDKKRVTALFVLEGDSPITRKPVYVATQSNLSEGLVPIPMATSTTRPSGSNAVPGVNQGGKTIKKRQRQPAKKKNKKASGTSSGAARGSRYEYRSIASLNEEAESMCGSKGSTFNVYGVIIGAKAPSTCTTSDLRSTITILDESSVGGTSDIAGTKVLEIYRFDKDPRCAIPFCVRGDIVRCHRLQLSVFNGHVQGHAQNHSTFLMWAADTNDEKPILEMAPVRNNMRTPIANHTRSDADILRVNKLREFSRRYLSELDPPVDRPWLKTVDQVVNAGIGADFLDRAIQIIGKYIPSKNGTTGDLGGVKFNIRDGVKEDVVMTIESTISQEHRNKMSHFPFEAFARSLTIHSFAKRDTKWMLINEIRVHRGNSTAARNGKLQVGRHTSTIEWLPEYAPEVRAVLAAAARSGDANGNNVRDGNNNNRNTGRMDGITSQSLRDVADDVHAETVAETMAVNDALAARWTVVGIHPGTHLKVESVRAVLAAARKDERKLMRVQAKVACMDTPSNIADATKLYCEACAVYTGDSTVCPTCGGDAAWTFRARIVLVDEDGAWIHAWITDDEFFKPLQARKILIDANNNSIEDNTLIKWIYTVLDKLLLPATRFDCLVQPYAVEAHADSGINSPAARIVHTQVLQPLEGDDAA